MQFAVRNQEESNKRVQQQLKKLQLERKKTMQTFNQVKDKHHNKESMRRKRLTEKKLQEQNFQIQKFTRILDNTIWLYKEQLKDRKQIQQEEEKWVQKFQLMGIPVIEEEKFTTLQTFTSQEEKQWRNKQAFKEFLNMDTKEVRKFRREFNLYADNFTEEKIDGHYQSLPEELKRKIQKISQEQKDKNRKPFHQRKSLFVREVDPHMTHLRVQAPICKIRSIKSVNNVFYNTVKNSPSRNRLHTLQNKNRVSTLQSFDTTPKSQQRSRTKTVNFRSVSTRPLRKNYLKMQQTWS